MDKRPNILFICSDQHTPRVMGAYGDKIIATPNLDALAADGTRFDNCYCNNPICVPSRMSFMTGRYSFNCEVLDNFGILDSRIPTLAHIAARGKYHPVLSGKMHFYGPDQRHGYLERPLGEMGGQSLYNGGDRQEFTGFNRDHLGNCSRPDSLKSTGAGANPLVEYDKDATAGSIQWLEKYVSYEEDKKIPFFLTVGYLLPHCPFIAPTDIYEKYKDSVTAPKLTEEELGRLHPHHQRFRKEIELDTIEQENFDRAAIAYYALTDLLDQNIGKLFETLKRLDLWENTIIIYTSDHGEMLGRHGRWHKESFYEDSLRIPFIYRDPTKKTTPVVKENHSLVDIMPTICELVGVKKTPMLDGASMLPAINGEETYGERIVKAETYTSWDSDEPGQASNRMVRKGPWKLCYYGHFDSYELFNVEDDPEECNNLANSPDHTKIVDELKPLIFEDGWSKKTCDEIKQRFTSMGLTDNLQEYRDTIRLNPMPMEIPDYWDKGRKLRTYLDGDPE